MQNDHIPGPEPRDGAVVDDKVRKDLVQVFFGLVLTQMAVYFTSLINLWDIHGVFRPDFAAAWAHLALAFTVTTASWFGWQMSVRKEKLNEEASIFQAGFVLSALDIILVALYFLLVHGIEMSGVAAFPPSVEPRIDSPSARPEVCIIIVVFAIYAVWDSINWLLGIKGYGPWPSVTCGLLCVLPCYPVYRGDCNPWCVILIDVYLIIVVVLFRALKRLQKWNVAEVPGKNSFRRPKGNRSIMKWMTGLAFATAASGVSIAVAWQCGW